MSKKSMMRMAVDMLMTIALICLMAYSLVGETAHEVIGISMFALFIIHHLLNSKWSKNIFIGKYNAFRIWQTLLVVLIFICMLTQMFSGIVLSKHIFKVFHISFSSATARTMHMLGAYWGFVLMSLHLGLHLGVMFAKVRTKNKVVHWTFRVGGIGILLYGLYAFLQRGIMQYLFLINQFAYFNMNESRLMFFFDYAMIMGAFAVLGHYFGRFLKE